MADWYWMRNGEKHGPVDTAGLKQLAQTGQLQPTDTIWREGLPNWVPASQANGLEFGASRSTHDGTSVATAPARPSIQQPVSSRGIIKYRCFHCGGVLESEGGFAGKQDTCPMCGKATPVPLTSTMGAGAFFRKIPKAVYIGTAAVVLVAVISLTAWLALRDTWERDHGPELRQMSEQTISLIRAGEDEAGVAKYETMLALVGDRQLEDPLLRQAVADAREKAEPAKRQLEERQREAERQRRIEETLATAHSLESEALRLGQRGDLQGAVEKYQLALSCIEDSSDTSSDFAAATTRLTNDLRGVKDQIAANALRQSERARAAKVREDLQAEVLPLLNKYYDGPVAALLRQLQQVSSAADSYDGSDIKWFDAYGKAYREFLRLEELRIKAIPTITEERQKALGAYWESLHAADNALTMRISYSKDLHGRAVSMLYEGLNGKYVGVKSEIGKIVYALALDADAYAAEAIHQYNTMVDLSAGDTLSGWPARVVASTQLSCEPAKVSQRYKHRLAALDKDMLLIAARLKELAPVVDAIETCARDLSKVEMRRLDLQIAIEKVRLSEVQMDSLADEVAAAQGLQAARTALDTALATYNASFKTLIAKYKPKDISSAGLMVLQKHRDNDAWRKIVETVLYDDE